jgi:cytochrome P450
LHYAAAGKGTFARIRQELEMQLGVTPDTLDGEVFEAITKVRQVPYIVSFVDEALRMQPIVAQTLRMVVSPIEIHGKVIPKGWNLAISMRNTIETAPTFEENSPLHFDAERFIKTPPDGLEYCPFGAGRRGCPGQEAAKLEVSMMIALVALKGDLAPAGDPLPAMWPVDPMPKAPVLVFDFMPFGVDE